MCRQSRGAGQAPHPTPSPASASPLLPTCKMGTAGGSCALLKGPSYCSWAPLGSLGHPSHPLHSPQGNACEHRPCCSSTDFPRPFAPELKKSHICDCLHPSPASPLLPGKHSPFPAAWDVFFFIAIVTACKYLRLAGF